MSGIAEDLRPLRIIGAALITGPALLLGVVIFLRNSPGGGFHGRPEGAILTWVALLIGLSVIGVSLLLPRPKGGDLGRIRAHFITRLALVEGGALFAAVAYLLEGEPLALGMGALCIAAMLVLHFPTRERVLRLLDPAP